MRVVAGGALLAVVARAVAKVRDEQTLWRYTIVVLVAYLFLTPWFLYWYMLAPLTMIAVLPTNRFTYPILTFSGTSLFSIGLATADLRSWIPCRIKLSGSGLESSARTSRGPASKKPSNTPLNQTDPTPLRDMRPVPVDGRLA